MDVAGLIPAVQKAVTVHQFLTVPERQNRGYFSLRQGRILCPVPRAILLIRIWDHDDPIDDPLHEIQISGDSALVHGNRIPVRIVLFIGLKERFKRFHPIHPFRNLHSLLTFKVVRIEPEHFLRAHILEHRDAVDPSVDHGAFPVFSDGFIQCRSLGLNQIGNVIVQAVAGVFVIIIQPGACKYHVIVFPGCHHQIDLFRRLEFQIRRHADLFTGDGIGGGNNLLCVKRHVAVHVRDPPDRGTASAI